MKTTEQSIKNDVTLEYSANLDIHVDVNWDGVIYTREEKINIPDTHAYFL